MDALQDLDLEKLDVDEHIQAIKFYSFLKFKRMIVENIKTEIQKQIDSFKLEVQAELT
jgi:hypothetical protein